METVSFSSLEWLNPPQDLDTSAKTLKLTTLDKTDFWRKTFYGFERDSGHFGFVARSGDFSAEVSFAGVYEALYDQAGMMVRLDAHTWLKTGIEYTDGKQHLSAVVTRGVSDWSVLPLASPPARVRLRVTRLGSAVLIQYALDGESYAMLRLAALTDAPALHVGVMACSPERAGFNVAFEDFRLGAPVSRALHGT